MDFVEIFRLLKITQRSDLDLSSLLIQTKKSGNNGFTVKVCTSLLDANYDCQPIHNLPTVSTSNFLMNPVSTRWELCLLLQCAPECRGASRSSVLATVVAS